MNRFREFLRRLRSAEQVLLVRPAKLLSAIRIDLWLLPFKVLQRVISKLIKRAAVSSLKRKVSVERVWRCRPQPAMCRTATCLTRALAAQVLLALDGTQASVQISVTKGNDGVFDARAWLEAEGKILLGGSDSNQRYARLLVLGRGRRRRLRKILI
jgi:hypothetical protein